MEELGKAPLDKIRYGGLLRCCIYTLCELNHLAKEGDTIQCKYCKSGGMRFRDGAWEWDHDTKEAS